MPMTQPDIRDHYEQQWKSQSSAAASHNDLAYSNPVEDAVLYPAYLQLLRDHNIPLDSKSILDVGSGSGRWIGFFLANFKPAEIVGIDFTKSSIDLLQKWWKNRATPGTKTTADFRHASITDPTLDLGRRFDLINAANVLFHIPEEDLFAQALANIRKHLAPGGAAVITEFLPRVTMRTDWMMVRSRYQFEDAISHAGLRIAAVRATSFFSNDPLGLDGPDSGTRAHFNQVRATMHQLLQSAANPQSKQYLVGLFAEIERATLAFSRERLAEVDLPSQKLVLLTAA